MWEETYTPSTRPEVGEPRKGLAAWSFSVSPRSR